MTHTVKLPRALREEVRTNAEAALPPPAVQSGDPSVRALARVLARALDDLSTQLTTQLQPLSDDGETGRPTTGRRESIQEQISLFGTVLAALAGVDPAHVQPDRAGLGSHLRVHDLESGERLEYRIVPFELVDGRPERVTLASPVGQVLVGTQPGDEVEVVTPSQRRRVRVESVATIWDAVEPWNTPELTQTS